jgi:hypothetical protein
VATGVFSSTRAAIKERTLRTDRWWLQPAITVAVLISFIIYATFRAFEKKYYFAEPLISPFYSPCLSTACIDGSAHFGTPIGTISLFGMIISPALFILIFPLGFRLTCYYYRKAYDAIIAFKNPEGEWGHMSVGTLVLTLNAAMLWLYSASCHTCRHTIGGRLKHFSKHPIRYKLWSWVSVLNHRHPTYAWISLFVVALSDLYVRAVASGSITNFYFF